MATIAVFILIVVLLMLMVAGSGIFPWTLLLTALLLSAAALAYLLTGTARRRTHAIGYASPALLLLLYGGIMLLPLPAGLYRVSPRRAAAHQQVQAAYETAATQWPDAAARPPRFFSLTRNRAGTARFLLWVISLFSAWAIIRYAPVPQRERILHILLMLGACMAIAGIVGKWIYPQGDTLYWYLPVPHGRPGPMGGFMNRNHFAGYMAILAPAAFAYAARSLAQCKWIQALVWGSITSLLSLAILLSLSRGGTLAGAAGLLAAFCLLMRHTSLRQKALGAALASICLIAALTIIVKSPPLQQRLANWQDPATTASLHTRWQAWQDTVPVANAYPLIGAGPNAFKVVFPQHRISSERVARDFAENEYVQWGAETGLIGLLILLLLVRRLLLTAGRARGGLADAGPLQAAALGALAAAAVHACVDFPLRLPLYAITLAAIAALLWPAPHPREPLAVPRPHPLALATGLCLALLLLPVNLQLDAPARIGTAPPGLALQALRAAPTYPIVWRRLAALLWEQDDAGSQQQSVQLLSQAAAYDPNHYVLWRLLGDRRLAIGDREAAAEAYQRVRDLRDWVRTPTLLQED